MLSLRSFLQHILDELSFVLKHTDGIQKEAFLSDETLTRAVVRSLEIIGEATKKLPETLKRYIPKLSGEKCQQREMF